MKILLFGISVRAMAESAVHSGYPVVALDAFGDQDLRILTESYSLQHDFHATYGPKALYEASRSLAFDAVAYTSNLENHADILVQFADSHRIIGNSPQVVQSVRHWPTLITKLTQAGFSVPETIFAGDSRKIDHHRQWLIKPVLSGGGHGIAFASRDKHCVSGFMLQEYINGKPCSASFVSNGYESVLLGITEQLIGLNQFGSRGFRYCGNVLPLPELDKPAGGGKILEQVNNLAAFLTQEYGLIGVNGMDFILKGDRVYFTEVNPRYSASMELIERAYKLPIFHLHVQAILEGRLPVLEFETLLKNKKFFGKAILFAERNAKAPDTRSWPAEGIRDIPASGEKLSKGGPICTILTCSPTYNEVLADSMNRAGMLKEAIYGKTDCDPDYGTFYQTGDRNFDWKGTRRISGSH
jgi:predicted ATP-grasp superfamily ATP-dependent carboligase